MEYEKIVQDVIEQYKVKPVDMLAIGDAEGEYNYLASHKDSYIRTVRDIDSLYKNRRSGTNILEIGSFLGVVSISLKDIGYDVFSLDIPEYHNSPSLRQLYESRGIPFTGLNVRRSKLLFESNFFDAVILCQVIEHLNFNPLPFLMEVNRVLKRSGYIYIGMPNQSRIDNRLKLLMGKSIHNPVDDLFKQLDKKDNMIVGLHWREYTLSETVQILGRMGFKIRRSYYFMEKIRLTPGIFKSFSAYIYPPFRSDYVVIGEKVTVPTHDFWLTDANS